MTNKRLIIFDFDGVISDSLVPHLKFVKDEFKYFNIPAEVQLTKSFGRKIAITPMSKFTESIAAQSKLVLPDDVVNKIVIRYEERFVSNYETNYFKGINVMLENLHRKDYLVLGIVSVNIEKNLKGILGNHFHYFSRVFTGDKFPQLGKAEKMREMIRLEQVDLPHALYVGDMRSDYEASKAAGISFLGVRYGWGVFSKNEEFITVGSVAGLEKAILGFK